jgi:hypothetical protein
MRREDTRGGGVVGAAAAGARARGRRSPAANTFGDRHTQTIEIDSRRRVCYSAIGMWGWELGEMRQKKKLKLY